MAQNPMGVKVVWYPASEDNEQQINIGIPRLAAQTTVACGMHMN